MPFYHVVVFTRDNPQVREIRFDLDLDQLEARFLRPYRRGEPLTIEGKSIPPEDVERIRIYESENGSTHYLPIVEQERQRSRVLRLTPPLWDVIEKTKNVTEEFITGPPGSENTSVVHSTGEHRPAADARDVFVVHGRNYQARDALFQFLRSIDLHPLEWTEAIRRTGKGSPYIGDILDAMFSHAHAVVVLFTPDDEAKMSDQFRGVNEPPYETELSGQARPNVLFEAGMAMGRYPDRTILVEIGTLRPFSDISGIHVVRLDNSPRTRHDLVQRLQTTGCPVNSDGNDWYSTGDFEAAINRVSQETTVPSAPLEQEPNPFLDPQLSEEALFILSEARKDDSGLIRVILTALGKVVQTNGTQLGRSGDRRALMQSTKRH